MNLPLHTTDPVAWLVHSDWLEDQGRLRAAAVCRRIAKGLETGTWLIPVICAHSRSVWRGGRSVLTKTNEHKPLDWVCLRESRIGWLTIDWIQHGWSLSKTDHDRYIPRWQSVPGDWPGMIKHRPLTAWRYFLTLARLADGRCKRVLKKIPG